MKQPLDLGLERFRDGLLFFKSCARLKMHGYSAMCTWAAWHFDRLTNNGDRCFVQRVFGGCELPDDVLVNGGDWLLCDGVPST